MLEDPKTRVRICRDDIRRMLGPYWVPSREKLVTYIEENTILLGLLHGYSVVVDATNFKHNFETILKSISTPVETIIKDFTDVSVEECIERDSKRSKEEQVGAEVIMNMYNKYLKS